MLDGFGYVWLQLGILALAVAVLGWVVGWLMGRSRGARLQQAQTVVAAPPVPQLRPPLPRPTPPPAPATPPPPAAPKPPVPDTTV